MRSDRGPSFCPEETRSIDQRNDRVRRRTEIWGFHDFSSLFSENFHDAMELRPVESR